MLGSFCFPTSRGSRSDAGGVERTCSSARSIALRTARTSVAAVGGRLARLALAARRLDLRVAQRLAPRVREEAVEGPADVLQVEADRRGASGTIPERVRRQVRGGLLDVGCDLDECVRDGHEVRRHALDRT